MRGAAGGAAGFCVNTESPINSIQKNGNEKVVITQEKVLPNIIQVYNNNSVSSKYKYYCSVKSCNPKTFGLTRTLNVRITNKSSIYDNNITAQFPHLKKDIPIVVLFKGLGCLTDKEIIYNIIDNNDSHIDSNIITKKDNKLKEKNSEDSDDDLLKIDDNRD